MSIVNIGTTDFPAPRRTPDAQLENARRKKNSATVLPWIVPKRIASGASTKILRRIGIQIKRQIPTSLCHHHAERKADGGAFFARSALPAPRFWLTKVVSAMDMLMIGRNAIPSSFAKAPCPEIANAPNVLIFDWTTRFPMLMTEFWRPSEVPGR